MLFNSLVFLSLIMNSCKFKLSSSDILAWVSLSLGFGSRNPKPKTQRDPDSGFYSVNFGIEINKYLKFWKIFKIFGSKKFKKIFLKSFKFFRNFQTQFGSRIFLKFFFKIDTNHSKPQNNKKLMLLGRKIGFKK